LLVKPTSNYTFYRTQVRFCFWMIYVISFLFVFGRPFVKRFALCYRTVVLSVCPICNVGVLWPNDRMDQHGTWHGGGPWSRPHCVRWGPSSPPQKGDRAPQFLAHFYCGQTAGWIKMPLGMEVGLGPGDFVLDGDPAPLPKKGAEPPNFWPMSIVSKRLDGSRCHVVRR